MKVYILPRMYQDEYFNNVSFYEGFAFTLDDNNQAELLYNAEYKNLRELYSDILSDNNLQFYSDRSPDRNIEIEKMSTVYSADGMQEAVDKIIARDAR